MLAALQAALEREPLIVAAAVTTPDQRVTAAGAGPGLLAGGRLAGRAELAGGLAGMGWTRAPLLPGPTSRSR